MGWRWGWGYGSIELPVKKVDRALPMLPLSPEWGRSVGKSWGKEEDKRAAPSGVRVCELFVTPPIGYDWSSQGNFIIVLSGPLGVTRGRVTTPRFDMGV